MLRNLAWTSKKIADEDVPFRRKALSRSNTQLGVHRNHKRFVDSFLQHAPKVENDNDTFFNIFWAGFLPEKSKLVAHIFAGFNAGVKLVINSVVYSSMVFNSLGTESPLVEMLPVGITINLMTNLISVFMSMRFSAPHMVASIQTTPFLILTQVAGQLDDVVEDKANLGHTLMFCIWMSAVCAGVLSWLLGRTGAGTVVQRMPSPVMNGFMGTVGFVLLRSAFSLLVGVEFFILWPRDAHAFSEARTYLALAAGFGTFLCIRFLGHLIQPCATHPFAKSLVNPLCLLLPLATFYLYVLCTGSPKETLQEFRERKQVYEKIDVGPFYSAWREVYNFDKVDWKALRNFAVVTNLIVLQIMVLLSQVLQTIDGVKSIPTPVEPTHIDLSRELKVTGCTNILSGIAGGAPCYPNGVLSMYLHKDGGTHRITMLFVLVCILVVFLSGLPIASFVPKFYIGGIFLDLGVDCVYKNMIQTYRRMDRMSYLISSMIVIVGFILNFIAAVGLGLVLTILMFTYLSTTSDPIVSYASSDRLISSHLHTREAQLVLWEHPILRVICLQGPIFFGNASQLASDVQKLLENTKPTPRHVIVCLESVTVIDDTGEEALKAIKKTLTKMGVRLHFTNLHRWKAELDHEDLTEGSQSFDLLDDAVRWCENDILEHLSANCKCISPGIKQYVEDERAAVSSTSADCHLASNFMSRCLWEKLTQECRIQELVFGETVFAAQEPCNSIHILVLGKVKIFEGDQLLRHACPLALLGVVDFIIGRPAYSHSARVSSREGATIHSLTRSDFNRMKVEPGKQALCWAFMDNLLLRSLCYECVDTVEAVDV